MATLRHNRVRMGFRPPVFSLGTVFRRTGEAPGACHSILEDGPALCISGNSIRNGVLACPTPLEMNSLSYPIHKLRTPMEMAMTPKRPAAQKLHANSSASYRLPPVHVEPVMVTRSLLGLL